MTEQINEEILEQNSSNSSEERKKISCQSPRIRKNSAKSSINLYEDLRDTKQMLENKQIKCKYMNTREKYQEDRELELDVMTQQNESPAIDFNHEKFDFGHEKNTESIMVINIF